MRELTETAIAGAANLLNPDLIVFGGHLGEAPESFIYAIRAGVLPFERSSSRPGAGAMGGAAVALDHLFYSGAPR